MSEHKYIKRIVLLLLAFLFVNCNNQVNKGAAVSNGQNIANNLKTKGKRLFAEAKYDSLITEAKKALILVTAIKDKASMAYANDVLGIAFSSKRQLDSAVYYLKKGEKLAIEIKHNGYMVAIQTRIAELYYDSGKPDSVTVYKDKMTSEADTIKNIPLKMQLTQKLADIYGTTNQPEKALKLYFPLLEYYRGKKDSLYTGIQLCNIAGMYAQVSDFNKAIDYSLKGIAYLNDRQYTKTISYNDLGSFYIDVKKYDEAINAFKKCIALAKSFNNISYMEDTYVSIASPLIELKQFKQGAAYLDKAQEYYAGNKYETGFMYVLIMRGKMARNQGNYQKAIVYFEKSLEIAKRTAHFDSELYVSGLLADVFGKAGLYQRAYQYEVKYNIVRDSLEKTNTKKNITDLEIKYQSNEKEQKIALLNQASKLKDIELTDEKRKWWFLLAFVGFLLVIAFLLYRSYEQKRISHKLLEEKNEALNLLNGKLNEANSSKTKLFSILSHDLRAPVNSLFQFLNIQKNHAGKLTEIQRQKHNERIINSAENLMESMEDLLIWSKSQMDSFSLKLNRITALELISLTSTMYQDFAEERKLIVEINCAPDINLTTDVNFLKIVLRNILSNAIKFTPAGGHIKISAEHHEEWVYFSIADNGPGLSHEQIENIFEWNSIRSDSSGLGLKLAKEFIDRLKGSIAVESELNEGTTFIVLVPAQPNGQIVITQN
ncbi:ATP-binding protein [Mucilaginibacter sp. OK098]|uniref:tetratricopeptide repeat-containing sensor histidine kinase n=1 Tax=Mucilaginibacter sp. OK098 TaxID=1855297 RepID=UPI001F30D7B2|nr:ATP-binding protein [Mucilaginibacter sp. OK098]